MDTSENMRETYIRFTSFYKNNAYGINNTRENHGKVTAGSEWLPEESAKCRRGSGRSIAYACRSSPALNFVFEASNNRSHCSQKQSL